MTTELTDDAINELLARHDPNSDGGLFYERDLVTAIRSLQARVKELEQGLVDQRRQLGGLHDQTIDELGRVRIAAGGEIARLESKVKELEAANSKGLPDSSSLILSTSCS